MSVPKTTVGGPPGGGPPNAHTEGPSPKGGEFDALLEEKESGRPVRRREGRPGPVGLEEGSRPTESGSGRGRSDRGAPGRQGSPPGTPGSGGRDMPAREAAALHALRDAGPEATAPAKTVGDADALIADPARSPNARWAAPETPAGGATQVAGADDVPGTADVAARVERIAEQIVQAAEVRLHADGSVEARLQLDLGRLGRLNVALEHTAEGRIRVVLEPTSAEGRSLCQSHGSELASRLEARGLNLQELTVESNGETVLRLEGAPERTDTAAARPTAPISDTASPDRTAGLEPPPPEERSDEDREGRRNRHDQEPSGEEEEA